MYNGHQLHRMHHRQYFDMIRERKSPGRPPRNTEMCLKNNFDISYSLNASLLTLPPAAEDGGFKIETVDDTPMQSTHAGAVNEGMVKFIIEIKYSAFPIIVAIFCQILSIFAKFSQFLSNFLNFCQIFLIFF